MNIKGNGALVISLDFELLWGVFDKVDWKEKRVYFQNTREIIPQILELFEKYEIKCTWATVGMLFNESWDEWNHNKPEVLPGYKNHHLSAYNFGDSIQLRETEELCFAPYLIRMIKATPNQEIGTHTYSHFYCLEAGQSPGSFRADLLKAAEMAEKFRINLTSLVFPRNQYNPEYLKVCLENGILNVRSNPDNWYWKTTGKDSLQQKVFRTGDAYIGLNDKSYSISEIENYDNVLLAQKASRLLRPSSGKDFLNRLRIQRIKEEMTYAAKNSQIYHLWWHPHNFAGSPAKNLKELSELLGHFMKCKQEYNFHSLSMKEVGLLFEKLN